MTTEQPSTELTDADSGSKVVYIDDEPDGRRLMEFCLGQERNDKVILCAPDLQQIRAAVEQDYPELVILSITSVYSAFMGSGLRSAFDFCQQLKAIPALQNVPVLLWRVPNPKAILEEAQRLGISGYTEYVCSLQELLAARDTLLRGGVYFPIRGSA